MDRKPGRYNELYYGHNETTWLKQGCFAWQQGVWSFITDKQGL